MRFLAVAALAFSVGAAAAPNQDVVEKQCMLQTDILKEIYFLYRQGASKQYIFKSLSDEKTTAKSRVWLSSLIDEVVGDSRSMFVNLNLTLSYYLDRCAEDPYRYIRDPDLLK